MECIFNVLKFKKTKLSTQILYLVKKCFKNKVRGKTSETKVMEIYCQQSATRNVRETPSTEGMIGAKT